MDYKRFVVAYCDLHTGKLSQEFVNGTSELDAINRALSSEYYSMEEVHEIASNSDFFVHALEI